MSRQSLGALRTLARLRGVHTSYEDVGGERHSAPPESLLAVLRAMGEEVKSVSDAPAALRRAREGLEAEAIAPVIVDWRGGQTVTRLRLAGGARARRLECTLTLEDGSERAWRQAKSQTLAIPEDLPVGRHELTVRSGRAEASSRVLTAPARVGSAHLNPGRSRDTGVFLPLHALRTARSWGTADLTDLGALAGWASERGAPVVGTLPLLAGFLDWPFDPSPYAPVSRLFFSELYIDAAASPDLALSTEARLLLGSAEFRREAERLRSSELVDYRAAMALKRRVLEPLARGAMENPQRRREIDRFARQNREAADFAAFRAAVERSGTTWQDWPEPSREGRLRRGRDFDPAVAAYYLYCQVLLGEQLGALRERLRDMGSVLYLDLPIGVHGGGYDTWRYRESFVTGVDVGAPPDPLAAGGQNWGFPPLHPHHSGRDGHEYFARCLRAHLAHARLLRLDHVMALHRLFWVPHGMEAKDGVYVRYPADELYAAMSIEAHRAAEAGEGGVRIVGENLGTVPEAVNKAMARRRVLGMYIGQFAFNTSRVPLPEPPAETLAALNTHDTPTFAAYYSGGDLALRRELGLADARSSAREEAGRRKVRAALDRFAAAAGEAGPAADEPAGAALRAVLERLASSPAAVVLLNLEDLWLEMLPQNIPGTTDSQYPNWRRKAQLPLEEFGGVPRVEGILQRVAELRLMPLPVVTLRPGTAAETAAEGAPTSSRGRGVRGVSGSGR